MKKEMTIWFRYKKQIIVILLFITIMILQSVTTNVQRIGAYYMIEGILIGAMLFYNFERDALKRKIFKDRIVEADSFEKRTKRTKNTMKYMRETLDVDEPLVCINNKYYEDYLKIGRIYKWGQDYSLNNKGWDLKIFEDDGQLILRFSEHGDFNYLDYFEPLSYYISKVELKN